MPTKFTDLKQGLLSGDPVVPSSNQSVVDQQRRLKDDKLARQQSHFIDEQIKKEHAEILQLRKTQRKILLVGQTASDKTALLKQFLLRRPLTQFNLDRARIYLNVLNSVQHILYVVALPDNNIVFHSPRYLRRQSVPNQDYPPHIAALATRLQPLLDIQNPLERYLQRLTNISTPYLPLRTQSSTKLKEITMDWNSKTDPGQLFVSCADVLVALWDDPTVQDALAKQPQSIRDSLPFFMDDLARIASRGYLPSLNDTLKLQRRPWGVQEYSFWFGAHPSSGLEWKIFDVGGAGIPSLQQAKYFQDVNAIVFLAPVDVFDQTLDEHPTVNCLKQTFLLWKEICSRSLLHNVAILLLMYKCDVLKAKLESGVQFCNYLAGYEGPNEPAAVTHHLEEKLTQLHNHVGSPQRPLYRYAMSGIDSSMVNAIIAMVQDRFLQQEMITLNLI